MTTSIFKAFVKAVDSFAQSYSPDIPVMWPNKGDDPPDTGMWLEARFFPNRPFDNTWAETCGTAKGFCQLIAATRKGQGEVDVSELADDIVAAFPKGKDIGGARVSEQPTRAPAINDDSRFYIPVTIYYTG